LDNGSDDSMSFVELNNDVMSEKEIETRRKFFSNPKNQADILLNNYIKQQTILVNHKQRKAIYAEFYRNAKKGKYKKLFAEYINGVSKEESDKKFQKLNG
jgi:predicted solute-binding protein